MGAMVSKRMSACIAGFGIAMLVGACSDGLPAGFTEVDCSVECPEGTKVLNFEVSTYEENYANGAFIYVENSCETACVPIIPCVRPNVPVVTADAFVCQGLEGLSDLEPPDEVDFSWMSSWDEMAVTP